MDWDARAHDYLLVLSAGMFFMLGLTIGLIVGGVWL